MNIRYINALPLAALACVAIAGAARASTITYTQTIAPTASANDYIALFSQFDPSLGTLTGAELSVTETTAGYDYIENKGSVGFFTLGSGGGRVDVNMPTIDVIGAGSGWNGPFGFLAPFDGLVDLSGPDSYYSSGVGHAASSDQFTDALTLQRLTGTFVLFDEIAITPNTGVTIGPEENFLYYNTVSGDVSLTYTYTPNGGGPIGGVPEPASWALMVLGVGGIGAMTRARRRQRRLSLATA